MEYTRKKKKKKKKDQNSIKKENLLTPKLVAAKRSEADTLVAAVV